MLGSDFTPPPFTNKEEAQQAIPKVFDQISDLLISDPSGVEAQEFLRASKLSRWIEFYFQNGVGPLHAPSLARDMRVAEIEEVLAPYEKDLVDLTFLTKENKSISGVSHRFLDFLPPTNSLRDSLLKLTENIDNNQNLLSRTYKLIYDHQFDDEAFRREVIDFILEHRDQRTRNGRFSLLLSTAAKRAAIPEMKEIYLNDLATPMVPENYIRGSRSLLESRIRAAATGIAYFGLLGEEAALLIQKQLREFDPKEASNRPVIHSLEQALEIVLGKRRPEIAYSRKGHYLGVSEEALRLWKKKNEPPVEEVAEVIEEVISPEPAIEGPAEVVVAEPVEEGVEPSSNWLLWLIGAVVVVAGMVFILHHKSNDRGK